MFGKALEDGNIVEMTYIVTSGSDGNGINSFTFSGSLSYVRNSVEIFVTEGISLITTPLPSSGGESIESVDSVRKFAPQIYATQNRALSASDYEVLIPNKIYPETESLSVFGGEELVPPQYGKVFISIKPRNGDFVPNLIKENIKRDLRRYSVAGIVPEILDLKYLFIETNSKVYYNTNLAPSASFVSTKVQRDLTAYAESSELNLFTHTWSLGVEEQFYFVFPLLIWFSGFARKTRNSFRNLFMASIILILASASDCFLRSLAITCSGALLTKRSLLSFFITEFKLAFPSVFFIISKSIISIHNAPSG